MKWNSLDGPEHLDQVRPRVRRGGNGGGVSLVGNWLAQLPISGPVCGLVFRGLRSAGPSPHRRKLSPLRGAEDEIQRVARL